MKIKVVPLFPCPEAGPRCPVNILDKYISKLPPEAKEEDLFYVQPLQKITNNADKTWYSSVPLEKHASLEVKERGRRLESVVTKPITIYVQQLLQR